MNANLDADPDRQPEPLASPAETNPVETKAVEVKAAEIHLPEIHPTETEPAKTKPTETKPTGAELTETGPDELHFPEIHTTETHPLDAGPINTSPDTAAVIDPAKPGVVQRKAARVLLIDNDGRVLLFRGGDVTRPEAGTWWFTPGGGVENDESLVQAARREVLEETGHVLPDDLGPVILTRTTQFLFEGVHYRQTESFYRVAAAHSHVDYSGWTEIERRTVHTHRWWSVDELRRTSEKVYPEGLIDLLTGS
jgi:8-oxo-dGTP pyrophosphatase MutT (NUDIX family)